MRVLLVMVVISLGKLVEAVVQDTVADHLLALDRRVVQGDEQVKDTDDNVVLFLIFLLFLMCLRGTSSTIWTRGGDIRLHIWSNSSMITPGAKMWMNF